MKKVQSIPRAEIPAVKRELERLKQASEDFEQVLVRMMLKEMQKNMKGGLLDGGDYQKMFEDMLLDERARSMTQTGQFGLARQIFDQLKPQILSQDGANTEEAPPPLRGQTLEELYHQVTMERIANENRRTSGDQE